MLHNEFTRDTEEMDLDRWLDDGAPVHAQETEADEEVNLI